MLASLMPRRSPRAPERGVARLGLRKVMLSRLNGLITCDILDMARFNFLGVLLKENARLTLLPNLKKKFKTKEFSYSRYKLKFSFKKFITTIVRNFICYNLSGTVHCNI